MCGAYLAKREQQGTDSTVRALYPMLVIGVSASLPILICAAWFWLRGAWPALHWTLAEFTPDGKHLRLTEKPIAGHPVGLIVGTGWPDYKSIDPSWCKRDGQRLTVLDLWRTLPAEKFDAVADLLYLGAGR